MIDLSGRTVLVTGASRGIGRASALLLARAGARVVVNYRVERHAAERVVQSIEEAGGEAFVVGADVAVREEADMLVEEAAERTGRLDAVVANAGIWKGAPIEEISDGEWSEMLAINLTGVFHVVRAAVPFMKEAREGRIVLISSTAGQRGEAGHAHYAATKGALISFAKSLAVELAPFGITTNCVAPGWVDTDMTAEALSERGGAICAEIPLRRPGRPEEIAGAVLYLVSDLASYVTGEVLNVNGGSVLAG